jgi:hypothetical protein
MSTDFGAITEGDRFRFAQLDAKFSSVIGEAARIYNSTLRTLYANAVSELSPNDARLIGIETTSNDDIRKIITFNDRQVFAEIWVDASGDCLIIKHRFFRPDADAPHEERVRPA